MIKESDHTIVGRFGAEYRGIVQYYLLAGDVHRLHRLRWVMETSMLKTLACKHRSSVSKMAARFKAKISTPHGPRTCFEARVEREGKNPLIARFGGIPLKRRKSAVLNDRLSAGPIHPVKELIDRLRRGRCELCQQTDDIQVHHVRQLADLERTGRAQPEWAQVMQARRRKSLVVCGNCQVADGLRRRADPDQAGVDHGLREVGVLGQESVAGVDGVGTGVGGRLQDLGDVQVAGGGVSPPSA